MNPIAVTAVLALASLPGWIKMMTVQSDVSLRGSVTDPDSTQPRGIVLTAGFPR